MVPSLQPRAGVYQYSTNGPDLTDEAEAQISSQAEHVRSGILFIASGSKDLDACFGVALPMLRNYPN
jgi:hypothetical protein